MTKRKTKSNARTRRDFENVQQKGGANTRRRWRQAKWLLWYFLSSTKCCFCGETLFDGFAGDELNTTLHHLKGNQKTDDIRAVAPVKHLRAAHKSCHKAHHVYERMAKRGKEVPKDKLRFLSVEARSCLVCPNPCTKMMVLC